MSEQNKDGLTSETNVNDFISELNAGMLVTQLGLTLSAAALGTVINGRGSKKGKVTLELNIQQIGENDQVVITSKISSSIPTKTGKKSEESATDTPMFVGKKGILTIDAPKESLTGQFNLQHEVEQPSRVRQIK